jgi:hypothetical protein
MARVVQSGQTDRAVDREKAAKFLERLYPFGALSFRGRDWRQKRARNSNPRDARHSRGYRPSWERFGLDSSDSSTLFRVVRPTVYRCRTTLRLLHSSGGNLTPGITCFGWLALSVGRPHRGHWSVSNELSLQKTYTFNGRPTSRDFPGTKPAACPRIMFFSVGSGAELAHTTRI